MSKPNSNKRGNGSSRGLPVAANAIKGQRKPTKMEKRLAIRIKDREQTVASSKSDLSLSFHKPGSLQK